MPKKPEVMSPAGYWPQLRAAIEAGADSVYFGLKHFTARAKVGFDLDELPEVMLVGLAEIVTVGGCAAAVTVTVTEAVAVPAVLAHASE